MRPRTFILSLAVCLIVFVGLITFTLGVGISSRRFVRPHVNRSAKLIGPPCREGLVSVEPQLDVPLRITISDAACDRPQEARVQWVAENIGPVPISRFEIRSIGFEIRSIETYDRPVDGRKGVITIGSSLDPHRTTTGLVGSSAISGVAGAPVLTSYKLTVWSVTYADGKTWTRAPAERSSS